MSLVCLITEHFPFQGLIDKQGFKIIDDLAKETQKAIEKGLYNEASYLEMKITNTVVELTKGIDIYNIVIKSNSTTSPSKFKVNEFPN